MSRNITIEELKRKLILMKKNAGKIYKIWLNDCQFEMYTNMIQTYFDPIFGSRYDFVTRITHSDSEYWCTSKNAIPKNYMKKLNIYPITLLFMK